MPDKAKPVVSSPKKSIEQQVIDITSIAAMKTILKDKDTQLMLR